MRNVQRVRPDFDTSIASRRIMRTVISTYGRETSVPSTSMIDCPRGRTGAAISRPLRNWLLTSPSMRDAAAAQARSLRSHRRATVVGLADTRARPVAARQSSRSSMGRSRIRGTPSSRYRPCPRLTIAVKKRMVVPELADEQVGLTWNQESEFALRLTATSGFGTSPNRAGPRSPASARRSTITSVSSLRSAPRTSHACPCSQASAASTSARLVMLFDPGTRTVAVGGRVSGLIASLSGYDGIERHSGYRS